MTETSEVRARIQFAPILLLIAIVLTTAFLFPGDTPFVGDEPWLLSIADKANHQPSQFLEIHLPFTVASVALPGTRGVSYGPFPVWLDQIILVFTRNPIRMVVIRALLCGTANAIALLWLTRSMGISGWYAPFSMLSPWLWIWARLLGDNCLCIPLTAMAIAAYGDFLIHHRRWTLVVTIVCLVASTLCHLFTVALIAAVAVHLVYFQRDWVKRWRWTLIWTCLGCFVVCVPYLRAMFSSHDSNGIRELAPADGWWFPLVGGHHLTAGSDWLPSIQGQMPRIFGICQRISLLPHLAVWIGMMIVALRLPSWISRRKTLMPKEHLAMLALFTAICQCLLDGIEQVRHLPHYLNATWIVYVIFAWFALDFLLHWGQKTRWVFRTVTAIYLASISTVTVMSVVKIHVDAGTDGFDYGTSMANQMEAAERINQFSPDSPIDLKNYQHWIMFPWAKDVMMSLVGSPSEARPTRHLVVRYQKTFPGDARIVVEDFAVVQNGR